MIITTDYEARVMKAIRNSLSLAAMQEKSTNHAAAMKAQVNWIEDQLLEYKHRGSVAEMYVIERSRIVNRGFGFPTGDIDYWVGQVAELWADRDENRDFWEGFDEFLEGMGFPSIEDHVDDPAAIYITELELSNFLGA